MDVVTQVANNQLTDQTNRKDIEEYKTKISTNVIAVISIDDKVSARVRKFNDQVLERTKMADLPDISVFLKEIKTGVAQVDPKLIDQRPGFLSKLFGKAKDGIDQYKERFDSVKERFDEIEDTLNKDTEKLKVSFGDIETMYKINHDQFIDLNNMIVAFEESLVTMKTHLDELIEKAKSGDSVDTQELREYQNYYDAVEKKHSNLVRSRLACIQTAAAVTLMKTNVINTIMTNITLATSGIEEWKKNVVLRIENNTTKVIAERQSEILNFANEMARSNADLLKDTTIKTTQLSERSNIDYETLEYVNNSLITTLDQVSDIVNTAREKRKEELVKIAKLEETLKEKIVEQNTGTKMIG